MEADPQHELSARQVRNDEVFRRLEDVEGHGGDLDDVSVAVPERHATHHHVDGADRLHLVHVVVLQLAVEEVVEVVQQRHDLHRLALVRDVHEVRNVAVERGQRIMLHVR